MTSGNGQTREKAGERGWMREKKFRPRFAIKVDDTYPSEY